MIDLTLILPLISGFLFGVVGGLLPGVGILTFTIIFWPVLMDWNVMQCLLWFMSVIMTAQFVGSVVATHFGILGETSSYTASIEGFRLYKSGRGQLAIRAAAIGSLISTALALIIFSTTGMIAEWIAGWYRTSLQVLIVVMVLIAVCFISQERSWISKIMQVFAGLFLGNIGQHTIYDFRLEVGFLKIEQALPLVPLLVGLYIIPNLIRNHGSIIQVIAGHAHQYGEKFRHWSTAVFYSGIGFIFGLTPGLTTDVASNISYKLQKFWEQRKKTYDDRGSIGCLTAAESANNAAAVSCMLPLLLFGVPITVSESLLYSIISTKGHVFSLYNFNMNLVATLITGLIVVAVMSYLVSGVISHWLVKAYLWLKDRALWIIGITLIIIVTWLGVSEYSVLEYILVLMLALLTAALFRKTDFYILIFSFAIGRHAMENIIRLGYLL